MSAMSKGSSATSQASVQDAKRKLTHFLKTIDTVPTQELEKAAKEIKAQAIAQTPYKSGKLESSVYVRVSKDKRRPGLVAGASARSPKGYDYAGIQHENESYHHPIKGKAHFISDPFNEVVAQLQRDMLRKMRFPK